jgi:hypothetical protein
MSQKYHNDIFGESYGYRDSGDNSRIPSHQKCRMSQAERQKPKKTKAEQIEMLIRLINAGKTQAAAATAIGVNIRTVQRWLTDPSVKERLASIQQEASAIAQTDPVVLSVVEVREQVGQILNYRDSQLSFAQEMGEVVQRSTRIIKIALDRIEANPDELSVKTLPQLLRAIVDASEKVSTAWSRATGLDDLLEQVGNEPKIISQGQEEA